SPRVPVLGPGVVLVAVLAGNAFAGEIAMRPAAGSTPEISAPPEPSDYRTDNYRSPVPLTLKGATVLSIDDAMKVWSAKSAIFIDVYPQPPKPANLPAGTLWRETTHQSIEDAVWLPNVGYGVLSAAADAYFQRNLAKLTQGDKTKEIVF